MHRPLIAHGLVQSFHLSCHRRPRKLRHRGGPATRAHLAAPGLITCQCADRLAQLARPFTAHDDQWNFGLEQSGITSEWVLALDADYVLSDELIKEIQALHPAADTSGYAASFDYCIDGRPLRGAAYPPVTVLYRRARARYAQDGHTQRVRVDGAVIPLQAHIFHDDRKSLTHWLGAQAKYMRLEADKLTRVPAGTLGLADRLRRWLVLAPPAMFLYCYLWRGGILDGKAGLFYALQRATSELILSLFLVRRWLGADPHGP